MNLVIKSIVLLAMLSSCGNTNEENPSVQKSRRETGRLLLEPLPSEVKVRGTFELQPYLSFSTGQVSIAASDVTWSVSQGPGEFRSGSSFFAGYTTGNSLVRAAYAYSAATTEVTIVTVPRNIWFNTLGTDGYEGLVDVFRGVTTVVAGNTFSSCCGWLATIDSSGDILTSKILSGISIADSTENSGSMLVIGSHVDNAHTPRDVWLAKVDKQSILWQYSYTLGATSCSGNDVVVHSNALILVGSTVDAFNNTEVLIAKVQQDTGNVVFANTIGSIENDLINAAIAVDDGVIFGGYTYESGSQDAWLLKLDTEGKVQWSKTYKFSGRSELSDLSIGTNEVVGVGHTDALGSQDGFVGLFDINTGEIKKIAIIGTDQADELEAVDVSGSILVAVGRGEHKDGDFDVWQVGMPSSLDRLSYSKMAVFPGGNEAALDVMITDGIATVVGESSSLGHGGTDGFVYTFATNGESQAFLDNSALIKETTLPTTTAFAAVTGATELFRDVSAIRAEPFPVKAFYYGDID